MSSRSLQVKSLPCLACQTWGVHSQPFVSEEHHLNLDGKAGQPRRGDEYSIPLCSWHHRGIQLRGMTSIDMAEAFGPSLAKQSRRFRAVFGTDDELLARTNSMLARAA